MAYALDRALGFRATKETRATLHELVQRIFTIDRSKSQTGVEYSQKEQAQSLPSNSCAKIITHALAPLIRECRHLILAQIAVQRI